MSEQTAARPGRRRTSGATCRPLVWPVRRLRRRGRRIDRHVLDAPGRTSESLSSRTGRCREACVKENAERDRAYDALAQSDGAMARLIAEHGHPDPFTW